MKIYVYDNANNGACNVAEHFMANWDKDKLHPKVSKIAFEVNRSAYIDAIQVIDKDEVVCELQDSDALRLDLLQEWLIKNT